MTPRIVLSTILVLVVGCNAADRPAMHAQTAGAEIFADSAVESDKTQPAAQQAAAVRERPQAETLAQTFDLQLKRLINDEPFADMHALPADERNLVTTIVDALATFRQVARNETSLLATKTASLAELSDRIRATQPLALPTLALCKSVNQFGIYDAFEPARFPAGKETPVLIYCEVDNFSSRASSDGRWETKLTYEAVLYTDGESGVSVISKKPTSIVDRCRNKRRDFFLADRMTLPAILPVGKYLLKVTVIDQLANRVAEKTLDLMVSPN